MDYPMSRQYIADELVRLTQEQTDAAVRYSAAIRDGNRIAQSNAAADAFVARVGRQRLVELMAMMDRGETDLILQGA